MKNRKWIGYFTLAFLALITIVSPPAYGDLFWESVVSTQGAPAGLPDNIPKQLLEQFNKTDTVKNYLTSNASRSDSTDGTVIIDFDTMTLYQLNTMDKTYTKVNMMSVMNSQFGQGMAKGMAEDMKVTPSNETKIIAGYKCKKYSVTMMGATSEYWLCKDVKGYSEFMSIGKKLEKMSLKNPALRQAGMVSLAGKLDGFPVQTVTNVMGITTTTTLKSIEEKPLSRELFRIPEGYKLRSPDND
jgi:hypothetical protein